MSGYLATVVGVDEQGDGTDEGLGLDEVLLALRRDLVAARGRRDEGYGLGVREVEIELAVEVRRRRDAKGSVGAKWFVLSGEVSGGGERERTDTHRIRLTLGPVSDEGEAEEESGGDASISVVGPAIAGTLPEDEREQVPDQRRPGRPVR